MIFCSFQYLKSYLLTFGFALVLAIGIQTATLSPAIAAPGGMGGGMGPVCPPACPPTPANCDANLILIPSQSLQFGTIAAPGAGTVVVDPSGARVATGGVVLLSSGAVSAASFSISTAPYDCTGRNFVVITVASPVTLNHTTLGATMTLDTFVTVPLAGDVFDPAVPLTVGGTLHVGASQTPGTYTGNILVTVTFQ